MNFRSLLNWFPARRGCTPAHTAQCMVGVNEYHRALSDSEIAEGVHRQLVGGMWEEIGQLQLRFLLSQGLKPAHALVDVGCGALRGGVHLVRFLAPRRYFGLDINASLIRAGGKELEDAGLAAKQPRLLVNDKFELFRFGQRFDFGIAVSLFTHLRHLRQEHIARCLSEMRKVMHSKSRYYCSYFEAPTPVHRTPVYHTPGDVTTYYDADP